jgi:DNA-binding response OmpR family regulator
MTHVVVVDDDPTIREAVADYLGGQFRVTPVANGAAMQAVIADEVVDLVLLDVKLAGEDGMMLARRLRDESTIPIIMLTGRREEADRVMGLELGADDYVTKPFSPRELVARIRAMLRRPRAVSAATDAHVVPDRVFGALRIDVSGRQLFIDDEPITLTRTEFDVLAALSARPGVVFSRRQLLDAVWSESWVGNEHLVDVHVGHLRRKLGDDPADPRYVITVRGVGYRMVTGK